MSLDRFPGLKNVHDITHFPKPLGHQPLPAWSAVSYGYGRNCSPLPKVSGATPESRRLLAGPSRRARRQRIISSAQSLKLRQNPTGIPMTTIAPQPASIEAALQEALVHQRAGRLSEAERLYRSILQARPDHPGISNNLGLALKDQGRLEEAAATFRRVIAVKPGDVLAHCNLGNVLRLQGRPREAADCYRGAIALKPDMALAHKNLGTVLCESDQLAESFASFTRHAELAYGSLDGSARGGEPVPPHKAPHDREQQEYLNAGNGLGA